MKIDLLILFISILFMTSSISAQEWKCLKDYQKETGFENLQEGVWLKKDRKRKTNVWKEANRYNLKQQNGQNKYTTLSQIRDFYKWFDAERKEQGHEILGIGIAAVAIGQFSKLDNGLIRFFIVRNKELVSFANSGAKNVFDFTFPRLKTVYYAEKPIKGEEALQWDEKLGTDEQCIILKPLYAKLSSKTLRKLDRMSKAKGIYFFGVPKSLKYIGSIEDCKDRYHHGSVTIKNYYLKKNR